MKESLPWAVAAIGLFAVVLTVDRTPSEWLSYIEAAANVVLAIIAVWAFIYARRQFGTSQEQAEATKIQAEAAKEQAEAAKESIRQSKVSALFELDRVFESPEMAENRRVIKVFRKEVQSEIDSDNKNKPLTTDQMRVLLQERCALELFAMRESGDAGYYKILNAIGFFETVGFMVDRDYLGIDDILRLYGGAVTWMDDVVGGHINRSGRIPTMTMIIWNFSALWSR